MNSQKNNNQTLAIIAAVLLILGLGGSYEFLFPQLQTARSSLAQVQAKNDSLKADIDTLQNAQSEIDAAKRALAAQSVNLDSLSAVYPKTEDVPGLYIQMDYLMGTVPNVTATYQLSAPVADGANGVRIPVSISATGSYANLKTFINALETNVRPVSITTLSFAQAPLKDKDGKEVVGSSNLYNLNLSAAVRAATLSSAYAPTSATK